MMQMRLHRFFQFFPPEQVAFLIEHGREHVYDHPTVIFNEGDEGGSMFLVLEGEVEIAGMTYSGHYQPISKLGPHDFFGEFSSIDGKRRNARASVPTSARLFEIKREHLLQALENSPIGTTQAFFAHVIDRVRRFHSRFFKEIVQNQKMLLIGELTNSIMHDLKSPMSIITGTSEMIRKRHAEDEETVQLCNLIEMQVKRVLEMTSEVLDFAKGSTTIVQKEINLNTLFPYFKLLNQHYFQHNNIELIVEDVDISLHADPDKLLRVLQNLANNAAQAMPNGGRIEIRAREKGDYVEIEVADNGPGIPEDIREHLFEPFVGEGKSGGTGLGTTIARNLVESHGGAISFTTSSEGTIFTICLPKRLDVPVVSRNKS
ncbi:MAG: cyclic nucleotide-binding protein [Lentisphaerae bacterium]|nr:MAG: cyclic nucleotide-binding protein [Lentisphaerota bacterium]